MSEVWDSMCALAIFGACAGRGVDVRIERRCRREALEAEVARLDVAARKERQTNRKNELLAQLHQKRRELAEPNNNA